ncbi:lysozyme [Qipengyuania sp. SM2507]
MQRRTVFDAVRQMLGRGFRRAEVAALDRAIDAALGVAGEDAHTQPHSIGPDGVALIKRFEGCGRQRSDGMVEAYPDPGTGGDPWTIGWGATGAGIGPGTVWTRAQCDERLACDLGRYAADVARAIGDAPTSQRQFDALASFHYNTGALVRSTLLRRHLAGDFAGAASEFARWKHAGGRVMVGLVRRRAAEARLYLAGE